MQNQFDPSNYAIVRLGGKNYKISVGSELEVDGLGPCDAGAEIILDKVLVRVSGESGSDEQSKTFKIGSPFIPDSKVALRVMSSRRGKKVLIFKKRRRKGYTKYQGHRQILTRVVVNSIDG